MPINGKRHNALAGTALDTCADGKRHGLHGGPDRFIRTNSKRALQGLLTTGVALLDRAYDRSIAKYRRKDVAKPGVGGAPQSELHVLHSRQSLIMQSCGDGPEPRRCDSEQPKCPHTYLQCMLAKSQEPHCKVASASSRQHMANLVQQCKAVQCRH